MALGVRGGVRGEGLPVPHVPIVSVRVPGLFGQWELRASAVGLTHLIVTSRLDDFPALSDAGVDEVSLSAARSIVRLAADEVGAYLDGALRSFSVPLDRPGADVSFTAAVHHCLTTIPFGCVTSYGAIAAGVGRPHAVRAVGSACGKNPLPVLVPCHRVTRSDGSLGFYTGGVEYKRALLALEGCLEN